MGGGGGGGGGGGAPIPCKDPPSTVKYRYALVTEPGYGIQVK